MKVSEDEIDLSSIPVRGTNYDIRAETDQLRLDRTLCAYPDMYRSGGREEVSIGYAHGARSTDRSICHHRRRR